MTGDKLSRGTSPGGDNRDTPIGGVSRPSRHSPVGDVPVPQSVTALILAETEALHDGEPVYGWRWDEGTGASNIACTVARTPMGQTDKRTATVQNMTGPAG